MITLNKYLSNASDANDESIQVQREIYSKEYILLLILLLLYKCSSKYSVVNLICRWKAWRLIWYILDNLKNNFTHYDLTLTWAF